MQDKHTPRKNAQVRSGQKHLKGIITKPGLIANKHLKHVKAILGASHQPKD
jgi:hypothetical protein